MPTFLLTDGSANELLGFLVWPGGGGAQRWGVVRGWVITGTAAVLPAYILRAPALGAFAIGNPFGEQNLLQVSVGRDLGALKGLT